MSDRSNTDLHMKSSRGHARQSVLMDAATEFCALERPTRKQIDQYRDLFYSLVASFDVEEKRKLAICHANNRNTPRTIAYYLALDVPSVASPVLLFSPVFNETDLLSLTKRTTEKHRQSIAHRSDLTPELVKALASTHDKETLRMLSKNPIVLKSPKAIGALEAALTSMVEPVVGPEDIAQQPAKKADAPTTGSLLRSLVKQKPAPAAAPLANSPASPASKLLGLAATGGRLGRTKPENRERSPVTYNQNLATALILSARKNDRAEVVANLASETGLSREIITQICDEESGERLARLLKALMIPKLKTCQLLLLMNRKLGQKVDAFKTISAYFDNQFIAYCQQELVDLGGSLRTEWAEITPIAMAKPAHIPQPEQKPDDPSLNLRRAMRSRRQVLGRAAKRTHFGRRDQVAGGYI